MIRGRLLRGLQIFGLYLVWGVVAGSVVLFAFVAGEIELRGLRAASINLSIASAIMFTSGVGIVWCIWLFSCGRKCTVLFLRKFGNENANRVVAAAVKGVLRRRARLFVLDDSKFPEVRVPFAERVVPLVFAIPFVLLIVAVSSVQVLKGPNLDNYRTESAGVDTPWTDISPKLPDEEHRIRKPWLEWPSAPFLWTWTALALTPICTAFGIAFRSSARVSSEKGVDRIAGSVIWARSWLAAPPQMAAAMTVMRTDDAVWQDAVAVLVKQCDVIVVDLSIATDSLRWEIGTCLKLAPDRTIFFSTNTEPSGNAAWHHPANILLLPVSMSPRAAAAMVAAHLLKHSCFAPDAAFASAIERTQGPLY